MPARSFSGRPVDGLVATDFDGTLSLIVEDPDAAVPLDGVPELLVELADHVAEVAVVSGRPLSFLTRFFGPPLTLVGLYGLETLRHGERLDHPSAGVWRETIADVVVCARKQGPADMRVESKDLSITLHYREHPERADEVTAYARRLAGSAGLQVRGARMSVELHPPLGEDKGTVIARLAADHTGPVMFIGDDVGDLPAFAALDEIERSGRPTWRVAVDSPELSSELAGRSDLVVDGPAGTAALLRSLVL